MCRNRHLSFLTLSPTPLPLAALLAVTALGVAEGTPARAQYQSPNVSCVTTFTESDGTDTTDTTDNRETSDAKESRNKEARIGYFTALAVGLGVVMRQWDGSHHSSMGNLSSSGVSTGSARLYQPVAKPGGAGGSRSLPASDFDSFNDGPATVISGLVPSVHAGSSGTDFTGVTGVTKNAPDSATGGGSVPAVADFSAPGEAVVNEVFISAVTGTNSGAVPAQRGALRSLSVNAADGPGAAAGSLAEAADTAAAPEPSEWVAMGMASASVGGLMLRARRRKEKQGTTPAVAA